MNELIEKIKECATPVFTEGSIWVDIKRQDSKLEKLLASQAFPKGDTEAYDEEEPDVKPQYGLDRHGNETIIWYSVPAPLEDIPSEDPVENIIEDMGKMKFHIDTRYADWDGLMNEVRASIRKHMPTAVQRTVDTSVDTQPKYSHWAFMPHQPTVEEDNAAKLIRKIRKHFTIVDWRQHFAYWACLKDIKKFMLPSSLDRDSVYDELLDKLKEFNWESRNTCGNDKWTIWEAIDFIEQLKNLPNNNKE